MPKHKTLLIIYNFIYRHEKLHKIKATQNLFSNKKLPRSPVISRVPLLLRMDADTQNSKTSFNLCYVGEEKGTIILFNHL